jgi:regulator of protease activity HflC (stomatin/prohibitin superfamily)
VPTFVFMDEKLEEVATLKERAESMTQVMEAEQLKVRRAHRVQQQDAWRAEMARELRSVVAEGKRYP